LPPSATSVLSGAPETNAASASLPTAANIPNSR
jgi:hypothetical protein